METEQPGDVGTADPAGRTLRLLTLLQVPGGATAAELARRLGVSTRTVRRDAHRLRRLGYTVRSRPGPGAGYQLVPGTRLPPLLLDTEEVAALVTGLQLLVIHAPGAGDSDAAASAMTKLVQVLPPTLAAHARATQLATEVLEAGAVPGDSTLVAQLADAIAHDGRLTFDYTDAAGTLTQRTVDPHRHVLGRGHWYLVGYDLDRGDWRTFRLDRIDQLGRVPGTYLRRRFPATTVSDWFTSDFGRHRPS